MNSCHCNDSRPVVTWGHRWGPAGVEETLERGTSTLWGGVLAGVFLISIVVTVSWIIHVLKLTKLHKVHWLWNDSLVSIRAVETNTTSTGENDLKKGEKEEE